MGAKWVGVEWVGHHKMRERSKNWVVGAKWVGVKWVGHHKREKEFP